jgi:hypothetical protein
MTNQITVPRETITAAVAALSNYCEYGAILKPQVVLTLLQQAIIDAPSEPKSKYCNIHGRFDEYPNYQGCALISQQKL